MEKNKNFQTCKEAIKTLTVTKTNLTAKIDKKYLLSTEAYFCHPHVKILTCHVNIIRNQKATCWDIGIV